MKKNLLVFILIISTTMVNVSAQNIKDRFKKLLGKDKSELAINAAVLPNPYININNKIALADTINFNNIAEENIFINALSYTIKQGEKGKNNIDILNLQNKSFETKVQGDITLEDGKTLTYLYRMKSFVKNNNVVICADSIIIRTPTLFGEQKDTPFENLNLQKERSLQQMQIFTTIYYQFTEKLEEYIIQTKPQPVTHWKDIEIKKVKQGMNATECLLCAGAPKYVRQSGTKTRWMMENNVTIIFEYEKVINIIQ